jgi:hypothetical protein
MQHALGPTSVGVGRQLEDRTCIASAAKLRIAVEVPCRVENHAIGLAAILPRELMQHALGPASVGVGRQLEDRTLTASAAQDRRTVKISCRIENQGQATRTDPDSAMIRVGAEAIQHALGPASVGVGRQLEGRASTRGTAHVRRA